MTDGSTPKVLYEFTTSCGRILKITNFGRKLDGFTYSGRELRVGWEGFLVSRKKKVFRFRIDADDKQMPIFYVFAPGKTYIDKNPSAPWNASGIAGPHTKLSGTNMFGIVEPSPMSTLNQSVCKLCNKEPVTWNEHKT
jgi:hypothetical protein